MLYLVIELLLSSALAQPSVYLASSCTFYSHRVASSWLFDSCADPTNPALEYSTDWKVCWILCCGDWSESRSWTSPDILRECKSAKPTATEDKTIMIIGIAVGGIFIFLVLGYVIYKLASGSERGRVTPHDKLAIIKKNIVRSLVWKSDWGALQESIGSNEDNCIQSCQECSICLDQGPNALLDCQHSFHYSCFLEWMKKSKECPLCRNFYINKIKVRCHKCNQKYTQIKFDKLLLALEELLAQGSICHECRQLVRVQKQFDDSLGTITHNNFLR